MTHPARHFHLVLLIALLLQNWAAADEVVRIGAENDWAPYSAVHDGKLQGMSVDIVQAAFAAADVRIELHPYPYPRCMEMARTGRLAACFNTAADFQGISDFLLSQEELFSDDALIWARRDTATTITDIEQLTGHPIAMTNGYEYGATFDNHPDLQRIPVRRNRYAFSMLQRGRVDFVAAYRGPAQALFRELPELAGQFRPVATLQHLSLFLSFSRRHPQAEALQQRFNRGLRTIKDNGHYQQILIRWRHHQVADWDMPPTLQGTP